MLQRALPFEHRPARTIVLCELRGHALKIGGKAFVRADQRATTQLFGRRRDEESLTYSEDDVSRRTEKLPETLRHSRQSWKRETGSDTRTESGVIVYHCIGVPPKSETRKIRDSSP